MDYVRIVHPEYTLYLLVAVAVSAVVTIVATERRWQRGVYLFKPLTMGLIIALALRQDASVAGYKALIIAGLVCSLIGDVFLMLPRDRFVAGLIAFLVAHLLYITAFVYFDGPGATWWIILPLAVYAAVLLRVLLPRVERPMKVPVIVYAAALLVMAWQAAERAVSLLASDMTPFLGVSGLLAAAGAALFVASDSALAVNRFVRQFRRADALVLGTYFAAQTLIALSIR
jgi:uncharacterized membrane protein YhhN